MYPHVTVATVVHRENKFLFVREKSDGKTVINQPAGHLELGESLLEAARRESFEETGWHINLTGFLGVSQFTSPANGVTYIRHSFVGVPVHHDALAQLDEEIIEAVWLSPEELQEEHLRSPMVMQDVQRFVQGQIYPLDIVRLITR